MGQAVLQTLPNASTPTITRRIPSDYHISGGYLRDKGQAEKWPNLGRRDYYVSSYLEA